jgi:hypothetical protein
MTLQLPVRVTRNVDHLVPEFGRRSRRGSNRIMSSSGRSGRGSSRSIGGTGRSSVKIASRNCTLGRVERSKSFAGRDVYMYSAVAAGGDWAGKVWGECIGSRHGRRRCWDFRHD